MDRDDRYDGSGSIAEGINQDEAATIADVVVFAPEDEGSRAGRRQ